ncbi:LacI family transcriptional regulator [bacterium]|nr:MAG: LacI family transcriptional regulator [bacterium]
MVGGEARLRPTEKMQRVRMIDVANAAGVSMTTASYVLNDRDVQIPTETRQRVWDAAKRLGFRPNRFAQNLAHQRSGLIGVLTPINPSPFHAQLTGELSAKASALSYTLIFEATEGLEPGADGFEEAINRLLQWRVDGLLLWSQGEPITKLPECPTVLFGPRNPHSSSLSSVFVDLYDGARQAARHLVELGHREIGFVGHNDDDPRWQALADVTSEAGLPPPSRVFDPGTHDHLRAEVERIAKADASPTAFLCISDVQALIVFRGLRNIGLTIPGDRSIVSCDESWAAENVDPALTSVAVPFAVMAEKALMSLIERVGSPAVDSANVVLTPKLNVRGSASRPWRD